MNLMTFKFDGATVRTLRDERGEPWFVAADVCAVLGIGNVTMALDRLDDDERTLSSIDGASNRLPVNTINESGLYSLILGSRKPEAKRFKKWVTAEVLPSIRKTGGYGAAVDPMAALNDPATMRTLLLGYSEKVLALETTVAAPAPPCTNRCPLEACVSGHRPLTSGDELSPRKPADEGIVNPGRP